MSELPFQIGLAVFAALVAAGSLTLALIPALIEPYDRSSAVRFRFDPRRIVFVAFLLAVTLAILMSGWITLPFGERSPWLILAFNAVTSFFGVTAAFAGWVSAFQNPAEDRYPAVLLALWLSPLSAYSLWLCYQSILALNLLPTFLASS